jgi:hypothetical protein
MADPSPRRFNSDSLAYIKTNKAKIDAVAGLLGVSPVAIAGSLAREIRDADDMDFVRKELHAYLVAGELGQTETEDQAEFRRDLQDLAVSPGSFDGNPLAKYITSPIARDMGPGAIKGLTAFSIIRQYGDTALGKALSLDKYSLNEPKDILKDLNDRNSQLSIAIAGLVIMKGQKFLSDKSIAGKPWSKLTEEQKNAALISYYTVGEHAVAQDMAHDQFFPFTSGPKGGKAGQWLYFGKNNATLTSILTIGRGAYLSVAPRPKVQAHGRSLRGNLRSREAAPDVTPAALLVPALAPYALAGVRGGAALLGARYGAVKMSGRNALSLARSGQFFRPPNVRPAGYRKLNGLSPEYAGRSRRSNINPWVARLSKLSLTGGHQNFAPCGASALGGSGAGVAVRHAMAFQPGRFGAARLIGRTLPSFAPRAHGAGAPGYEMARAGLDASAPNAPSARHGVTSTTDFWGRTNLAGGTPEARPGQTGQAMEMQRADRAAVKQAIEDHFALAARLPPAGMTGFDPRLSPPWPGLQLPG